MGGHSHWAGIKHKKGLADQKKGKVYTKIIREISIAAREGGGKSETNPRLRKAMEDARAANMPSENVERAILRGLGKLPGQTIEEVKFEGYGAGGVAIMVEATTDNKNRTTSEIRKVFTANGGNLAELGAVSWIFEQKGYFEVEKSKIAEDKLMDLAIEAGAQDIKSDEADVYTITTGAKDFEAVRKALEAQGVAPSSAEITHLPKNEVRVEGDDARKILALMEALEDHDDVKNVYANFDIPDEVLSKRS